MRHSAACYFTGSQGTQPPLHTSKGGAADEILIEILCRYLHDLQDGCSSSAALHPCSEYTLTSAFDIRAEFPRHYDWPLVGLVTVDGHGCIYDGDSGLVVVWRYLDQPTWSTTYQHILVLSQAHAVQPCVRRGGESAWPPNLNSGSQISHATTRAQQQGLDACILILNHNLSRKSSPDYDNWHQMAVCTDLDFSQNCLFLVKFSRGARCPLVSPPDIANCKRVILVLCPVRSDHDFLG